MKKRFFSIIVPVYNAEPYIADCINSLLNQNFYNFEIILVNDGSSDSSLKIITNYQSRDKRIVVLNTDHKNAGVARNIGLNYSNGEYLLFIDADDFVSNELLFDLYQATFSKPDIIIFGAEEYNHASKRKKYINNSLVISNCPNHSPFSPLEMNDHLFNSFQNWAWNKAYKRSFILSNNIRFQDVARSNDVLFVNLALSLSKNIFIINKPLITHRVGHFTNMQANNSKEPSAFWDAFSITYFSLQEVLKEDFEYYKKSFLNCALPAIKDYLFSMTDDIFAFNIAKSIIIKRGEIDFGFLSHSKSYYYDKNCYDWYVDLLKTRKTSFENDYSFKKFSIFNYIKGFFVSLYDNGFMYTIRRVLFHLHLTKDNDPQRTKFKH